MIPGVWTKSSFSGPSECVEVMYDGTNYLLRDTKDREGLVLTYTASEWDAFLKGAKDGEFDA